MRGIRILLCCMILNLLFPQMAFAEEIAGGKEPLDIVFVIDCSGSMKANDPSKMGLSMVQAFIDTVQTENIRVGYVAYSDNILSFSAPEPIGMAEKREALKEEIGAITYSRDTDIGLGVSFAYGLLSAEGNARQMMVLISDGETDLPKGGERTEEQSNLELEQCVRQCREENIQIHTVAFGQYEGSEAILEELAAETGAGSYSAEGPEELIEVLYGIFQNNLIYRIQQFSSGTYAGEARKSNVCWIPHIWMKSIYCCSPQSLWGKRQFNIAGKKFFLTVCTIMRWESLRTRKEALRERNWSSVRRRQRGRTCRFTWSVTES